MPMPAQPKIYHIVHVDRLSSIIKDGHLWCDKKMVERNDSGTIIGMDSIKQRRLTNMLDSHPGLYVGECVPFYFYPRSIMLYVIHRANNPELAYRGGQDPILHLEADLRQAVAWADKNKRRWAFTSSNAGSSYFVDYSDLRQLAKIDWDAVQARWWSGPGIEATVQEGKQAEFLIEYSFPWALVERIGTQSDHIYARVRNALHASQHQPVMEVKPDWYY